jgi:hypothetical protein
MSLLAGAAESPGAPRVRRVPRAASSDGPDAAFLASAYGLTPDGWQDDCLTDWMGRRKDGRWTSATCGLAVPRQNGKNGALEVRELFGMVELGERFLHTAHEVKTARKAFLRIASFFENERQFPELAALAREIRKTNGQEAIVLKNGGSIEFIARSKGSGRGFTVDVLVCDEAQDLTDEELAALLPTISAAPTGNPQVILTGTPPDPARPGPQGEVFRRVRMDGEANRDKRLAWTDFGVVDGPMPDVDDRTLWARVNPALGIRLNVAEVERERGLMSPETFARERLGWWGDPAQGASPIPAEAWAACKDEASRFGPGEAVLGLHVTADQRIAYLAGVGLREDGLIHVEVLTPAGVSTSRVVDELARLAQKRNASVWLDPGSHAGALIPDIEKAGVTVNPVTLQKLAQGCGMVINDVTTKALRHLGQDVLDEAVRTAGVRITARESWTWSGPNVAPLSAVTLALFGFHSGPAPYNVLESVW